MSALGQKQTFAAQQVMSALQLRPQKRIFALRHMCVAIRDVRFGPEADIPTCANNAPLWVKSGNQASNIDVPLPIGCSLWLTALTKDHSKQHLFSCGSPE
jgi:hypothetical protein